MIAKVIKMQIWEMSMHKYISNFDRYQYIIIIIVIIIEKNFNTHSNILYL